VKYFKNTELAKIYNVSEKSVRNWIQAARDGKLDLQLYEKEDKFWIANTTRNTALIEQQVEKGKKFKNSRAFKTVSPSKDFYAFYTQREILDIISNLTIHHEVPTQYTYADGAARYWDSYANRLSAEESPNVLNRTLELLSSSEKSLDTFIEGYGKVNIVDLGPGNGLPIRPTIAKFLEEGRLNRYIAIDSSKEMLDILEQNVKKWFKGKVKFEGYVLDFSYQRFDHLFTDDYARDEADAPINLVCLLGGTLSNFRSPSQTLQMVNQSMGIRDLLLYTAYLDTPATRRYFDFNTAQPNQKYRSELILEKMGIDDSLYSIEQVFDEKKSARLISIVPKIDLTVAFQLANGVRYVELKKNVPILLWRHWHQKPVEMIREFDRGSFNILQLTQSRDQQYLIMISNIKTNTQV